MADTANDTPRDESTLTDQASALRAQVDTATRQLKALAKALAELTKSASDPAALAKSEKALGKVDLTTLPTTEAVAELATQVGAERERLHRRLRVTALGGLHRAASEADVSIETLADSPPTVLLAPVVVTFDFESSRATVSYAREAVAETTLEASEILAAREQFIEETRDTAIPSADFFDRLRAAHAIACRQRGVGPDHRIDLVDLLGPLGLLQVEPEKWRSAARYNAYPRHMLAYQLKKLRGDGCLERGGVRLDLGSATGGSTRNKKNVLFVPTGADQGQYYLSIRFV